MFWAADDRQGGGDKGEDDDDEKKDNDDDDNDEWKIMMRAPHVWAANARLGGSEPSAAQSSPTLQKL